MNGGGGQDKANFVKTVILIYMEKTTFFIIKEYLHQKTAPSTHGMTSGCCGCKQVTVQVGALSLVGLSKDLAGLKVLVSP